MKETIEEERTRILNIISNLDTGICIDCAYCDAKKEVEHFTCGYHNYNFTIDSHCEYWTSKITYRDLNFIGKIIYRIKQLLGGKNENSQRYIK